MQGLPLDGIRVMEISRGTACAYCSKMLAMWGAEVIKFDEPGGAREVSADYLYLNTGKKSVTLNLQNEMGRHTFRQLLSSADILVADFKPTEMSDTGLDYDTLAESLPSLILTSVTGFGQTGPYRIYATSPMVSYATGGHMYLCGEPDRIPLNSGVPVSEYISGLYAFIGTMLALETRENTGKGQLVDISIMECMAASHQFTLTWPEYSGAVLSRPGWPGTHAPQSLFKCKDGYVNLRLQNADISFLSYVFDMPEIASDARFATTRERNAHITELEKLVADKIIGLGKKEVFAKAGEWRAICGFVATPADLLADEQYRSRNYWTELEYPAQGIFAYPGMPEKMSENHWRALRAPIPGENNQEIYCDKLGVTWQELKQMQEWGVI